VQFDRELRGLLVALTCAEPERLRAAPLALPGAFVGTAHAFAVRGEGVLPLITRSMRCRSRPS
jgi:hypothetical protein